MSSMKIALFTEVYRPVINGVVTSVENLAAQLRSLGHEAFTFAPRMRHGRESDGQVFFMPSLPLPSNTDYRLALPLVAQRNKQRFLSRCDVIHSHSLFVTGWMASYYARSRFRVPLVFTYHTRLDRYTHYSPLGRHLTTQLTRELTRTYANAADAVIVPTGAVAASLREEGVTAPICVVPTGIDLERYRAATASEGKRVRMALGIPPNSPVVLHVSRLAREKSVDSVIAAFSAAADRLPAARLLLVGSGPERVALEAAARAAGVGDRVVFAGQVAHVELPAYYAACDAFAFASTTETQGLVIAEAFAAGLPVVAMDAPQTRDVFGTHLAGALVQTAAQMADALVDLLSSPERRTAASAHAKAAAAAFDIKATTARTLAVYEAVRGGKSGPLSAEALFTA